MTSPCGRSFHTFHDLDKNTLQVFDSSGNSSAIIQRRTVGGKSTYSTLFQSAPEMHNVVERAARYMHSEEGGGSPPVLNGRQLEAVPPEDFQPALSEGGVYDPGIMGSFRGLPTSAKSDQGRPLPGLAAPVFSPGQTGSVPFTGPVNLLAMLQERTKERRAEMVKNASPESKERLNNMLEDQQKLYSFFLAFRDWATITQQNMHIPGMIEFNEAGRQAEADYMRGVLAYEEVHKAGAALTEEQQLRVGDFVQEYVHNSPVRLTPERLRDVMESHGLEATSIDWFFSAEQHLRALLKQIFDRRESLLVTSARQLQGYSKVVDFNDQLVRLREARKELDERPYFPLHRLGMYIVREYSMLKGQKTIESAVPFDTHAGAVAHKKMIEEEGNAASIDVINRQVEAMGSFPLEMKGAIIDLVRKAHPNDPALVKEISDLFEKEKSGRQLSKTFITRSNIYGGRINALGQLDDYVRMANKFLARGPYSQQTDAAIAAMKEYQAKIVEGQGDATEVANLITSLTEKQSATLDPGLDTSLLKGISFSYTIAGSAATAIVNLSQIQTIGGPTYAHYWPNRKMSLKLSGNLLRSAEWAIHGTVDGNANSPAALALNAWKQTGGPGNTLSVQLGLRSGGDQDLGEAFRGEEMSLIRSLGDSAVFLNKNLRRMIHNFNKVAGSPFHGTEVTARTSAFLTAYEEVANDGPEFLSGSKERPGTHRRRNLYKVILKLRAPEVADRQAKEGLSLLEAQRVVIAGYMAEDVMFDYSSHNRPSAVSGPAKSVLFQYQFFGLSYYQKGMGAKPTVPKDGERIAAEKDYQEKTEEAKGVARMLREIAHYTGSDGQALAAIIGVNLWAFLFFGLGGIIGGAASMQLFDLARRQLSNRPSNVREDLQDMVAGMMTEEIKDKQGRVVRDSTGRPRRAEVLNPMLFQYGLGQYIPNIPGMVVDIAQFGYVNPENAFFNVSKHGEATLPFAGHALSSIHGGSDPGAAAARAFGGPSVAIGMAIANMFNDSKEQYLDQNFWLPVLFRNMQTSYLSMKNPEFDFSERPAIPFTALGVAPDNFIPTNIGTLLGKAVNLKSSAFIREKDRIVGDVSWRRTTASIYNDYRRRSARILKTDLALERAVEDGEWPELRKEMGVYVKYLVSKGYTDTARSIVGLLQGRAAQSAILRQAFINEFGGNLRSEPQRLLESNRAFGTRAAFVRAAGREGRR